MFERLDSQSDVLAQVLATVRLGGALSSRVELRSPWGLHLDGGSKRAAFHVVADGSCWVQLDDDGSLVELGPGDVVLLPHGADHTLFDDPSTPPVEFADLVADVLPGRPVVVPSGDRGAPTTLLCGAYTFDGDDRSPLLRGLPALMHVRAAARAGGGPLPATIDLLASEAARPHQGSRVVVDRLVDLLFVYALRTWIDQQDASGCPTWFGALHDPVVGPALQAVHDDPARPWTVASLAQRAGLSRAPFARRFRELVGEPPLAYVTRWRMTVAADLLEDGQRIARVAHQVGYDNEFAFAKAFKRTRGVAPGQHRRQAAAQRVP